MKINQEILDLPAGSEPKEVTQLVEPPGPWNAPAGFRRPQLGIKTVSPPSPGSLSVVHNGQHLREGDDYLSLSDGSISFANSLQVGDQIRINFGSGNMFNQAVQVGTVLDVRDGQLTVHTERGIFGVKGESGLLGIQGPKGSTGPVGVYIEDEEGEFYDKQIYKLGNSNRSRR